MYVISDLNSEYMLWTLWLWQDLVFLISGGYFRYSLKVNSIEVIPISISITCFLEYTTTVIPHKKSFLLMRRVNSKSLSSNEVQTLEASLPPALCIKQPTLYITLQTSCPMAEKFKKLLLKPYWKEAIMLSSIWTCLEQKKSRKMSKKNSIQMCVWSWDEREAINWGKCQLPRTNVSVELVSD